MRISLFAKNEVMSIPDQMGERVLVMISEQHEPDADTGLYESDFLVTAKMIAGIRAEDKCQCTNSVCLYNLTLSKLADFLTNHYGSHILLINGKVPESDYKEVYKIVDYLNNGLKLAEIMPVIVEALEIDLDDSIPSERKL